MAAVQRLRQQSSQPPSDLPLLLHRAVAERRNQRLQGDVRQDPQIPADQGLPRKARNNRGSRAVLAGYGVEEV